jgi:hypothetical protein
MVIVKKIPCFVGRDCASSETFSKEAVSPLILCSSDAHAPKSINLQRSEQNGLQGFD